MEDEFMTAHDFCAVFDGHGGKSVSRYLKQNLYANIQAALPMVLESRPNLPPDDSLLQSDPTRSNSSCHVDDEAIIRSDQEEPLRNCTTSTSSTSLRTNTGNTPTVQDYEAALEVAIDKVDREVQRISHWSYQGSTAVAVWMHIHEAKTLPSPSNNDTNSSESVPTEVIAHLITANVGDSRAVLCRNGTALDLTRDHKPNDPIEKERIYQRGGTVVWHGPVDNQGEPVEHLGLYRVNGNLALSRAVGDRSERPAVTADPELSVVQIQMECDEFIILATDGLWDALSSTDAVSFVRKLLEMSHNDESLERDSIAGLIVEEALRRGSFDNITVIIVWLPASNRHITPMDQRNKKYWI